MPVVHYMEEHVGGVRPVGQVPYLVNDEDVRMGIGSERLLQVAPLAGIGEILDEFCSRREKRLKAVLDGSIPDGHCQMGFATTGLTVQDQRPSLGDEVRPEIGTEEGLPKSRLQREIELVDSLEEGEVCAPRAALQSRLLASRYFFGQQQSQEVPIRPTFLLRPNGHLLVNPAHVRQVKAPEVSLELALGEFQTRESVQVILCRHRCTSRTFRRHFLFHWITSWKVSER